MPNIPEENEKKLDEQAENTATIPENNGQTVNTTTTTQPASTVPQQNDTIHFNVDEPDNPLLATATTAIDTKLHKVTTKGLDIAIIIVVALGIISLGIWIVQYFVLKNNSLFYLSTLFFTILFIVLIYFYKAFTKKLYQKGVVNQYKFYQKYILLQTFTNGEYTGSNKIYYKSIIRRKYIAVFQDGGYLVLFYQSIFTPLYIHLQATPLEERAKLEQIFKIRLSK